MVQRAKVVCRCLSIIGASVEQSSIAYLSAIKVPATTNSPPLGLEPSAHQCFSVYTVTTCGSCFEDFLKR